VRRLCLVLRLVDKFVLRNPRHHGAQTLANFLDRVLSFACSHGLETSLPNLVFQHPVPRELAGLDFIQHALHLRLGLLCDDPGAAGVIPILSRIRNGVTHVRNTTFVDQIDDQLDLVQALKIGHLRGVTGFGQRLVTGLNEAGQATAQNDLFAEQICLALFAKCRLDDAGPATTNP